MLSLSPRQWAREYGDLYAIYDEGETTRFELGAFELLEPQRDGQYLIYGCGRWSRAVSEIRARGYAVWGFEPYSLKESSPYVLTDLTELRARRFDGIITSNVLEHLPDPVEEVRMMASLLSEGGTMVHATACFRYRYEWSRFHLHLFTGRSVDVLAERAGIEQIGDEIDLEGETYLRRFRQRTLV
jgi:SAM-dependent methyltransferase